MRVPFPSCGVPLGYGGVRSVRRQQLACCIADCTGAANAYIVAPLRQAVLLRVQGPCRPRRGAEPTRVLSRRRRWWPIQRVHKGAEGVRTRGPAWPAAAVGRGAREARICLLLHTACRQPRHRRLLKLLLLRPLLRLLGVRVQWRRKLAEAA